MGRLNFEATAVEVTDADTVLATVGTAGLMEQSLGFCTLELSNVDGSTIDSFTIQVQHHPNGDWHNFLSDVDFAATDNVNMLFASTIGPHEVAEGEVGIAQVMLNGVHGVRFLATVASGSATVDIRGGVVLVG